MANKYLIFKKKQIDTYKSMYFVYNIKDELLGEIRKHQVGGWQHWCFFPVEAEIGTLWFSNGCLKELVAFMTKIHKER